MTSTNPGSTVEIGGLRFATAGLEIVVAGAPTQPGRARAILARLPKDTHVSAPVAVTVTQPAGRAAAAGLATRAEVAASWALLATPMKPVGARRRVLIVEDEAGVLQILPPAPPEVRAYLVGPGAPADAEPVSYLLTLPTRASTPADGAAPAWLPGVVRKAVTWVFHDVLLPVFGDAAEGLAREVAERLEGEHWNNELVELRPPAEPAPAVPGASAGGPPTIRPTAPDNRALLLIHGFISSTAGGFKGLIENSLPELLQRYPAGVFGLDHFTISHGPVTNAETLLDELPAGQVFHCDVICHSRGGLVARVLKEGHPALHAELARLINVGHIAFVGSPNNGTPLADTDRAERLLSVALNLIGYIGAPGAVVEEVGAFLVQAAAFAVEAMPGIAAMAPGGDFLTELNAAGDPVAKDYVSIASHYEPGDDPFWSGVADLAVDLYTHGANDLVVPTASVSAANGDPRFPISLPQEIHPRESVHHCEYFSKDDVRSQLLAWVREWTRAPAPA